MYMYINVFPKRDRTVITILVDFSVQTWEVGLRNSPYEIRMLEDMTCKVVCKQALPGPRGPGHGTGGNWGILGTWDAKLCCYASTPEVTPEIGESFLTLVARLVDFEQSFDGGTVYIQTIDGFSERIIAAHWDFSYFLCVLCGLNMSQNPAEDQQPCPGMVFLILDPCPRMMPQWIETQDLEHLKT